LTFQDFSLPLPIACLLYIPICFIQCSDACAQELGFYKKIFFNNNVKILSEKHGEKIKSECTMICYCYRENAGVDICFNRLQYLTGVKVFRFNDHKGKYTEIEPVCDFSDAETDANYTGLKRFIVYLPYTGKYKITYSLAADDLILAGLPNQNINEFDSCSFTYKIPSKYTLLYRIDGDSSLISHFNEKNSHNFKIYTDHKLFEYTILGENSFFQAPLTANLRVMVVPSEYSVTPEKYFNQWYKKQLDENEILGNESKQIIDSLCFNISDTIEIVKKLYRFISLNINYVGMFDSWDAFIPQPVDEVIKKRFGDCKNMANLLTSVLNYKKIKAYYGITSSINHYSDMDFPSLASADHAICVVRVSDQWYFLDPTNKSARDLSPSGFIQGRSVLVMDNDNPFYLKIPFMPDNFSVKKISHEISFQENSVEGSFTATYSGYLLQALRESCYSFMKPVFSQLLEIYTLGHNSTLTIKTIDYCLTDTTCRVTGTTNLSGQCLYTLTDNKIALFPDFVEIPDVLAMSNRKFNIKTQMQFWYQLEYNLHFGHNVELQQYDPVYFNNNGLVYTFNVIQDNPQDIKILTEYKMPFNIIKGEDLNTLMQCSGIIQKTLKNAIEIR
jgi:hypothetical protein